MIAMTGKLVNIILFYMNIWLKIRTSLLFLFYISIVASVSSTHTQTNKHIDYNLRQFLRISATRSALALRALSNKDCRYFSKNFSIKSSTSPTFKSRSARPSLTKWHCGACWRCSCHGSSVGSHPSNTLPQRKQQTVSRSCELPHQ